MKKARLNDRHLQNMVLFIRLLNINIASNVNLNTKLFKFNQFIIKSRNSIFSLRHLKPQKLLAMQKNS